MLDRDIRRLGETVGYAALLEDVMPQLERYDWVVGNLEGPITNHASVSRGSAVGSLDNTRFTFAPEVADFLYTANIRLLHIGNNHIFDFGREGVLSTARTLTQHHLLYFGDVRGRSSSVIYVKKENLTVGLVSYNQFLGNGVEQALSNVEEARANADLVVLITHWGDEYEREPSREMRALARRFVDRGADIIVGTHPHVVIPPEVYNGAPIYYSLGNFIFDQYWEKTVRCGLALSVYVNRDGSFAHETASTSFSGGKVAWGSCL
jgi:poly-gamma-glutamate synthesis protein (capsule biosynthesis protein)